MSVHNATNASNEATKNVFVNPCLTNAQPKNQQN